MLIEKNNVNKQHLKEMKKVLLLATVFLSICAFSQKKEGFDVAKLDKNMSVKGIDESKYTWYDAKSVPFDINGLKWFNQEKKYRRLPSQENTEHKIPLKVERLANCTAGGQVRFKTNSRHIALRVKIPPIKVRYHQTPLGQRGFDCYVGKAPNLEYYGSVKFSIEQLEYASKFMINTNGMVDVVFNMPLYGGVESIEIGLDKNAQVLPPTPLTDDGNCIVVYGTSITQGGGANRPGMLYTNILSRMLNREVVNLGFSGSGKGEPEIARLITNIDKKDLIILDFEANTHEKLRTVLRPFIEEIRKKEKNTPILILSRIALLRDRNKKNLDKRISLMNFQKDLVKELKNAGDENIYFKNGAELFTNRWGLEGTIDGTHCTDLGYMLMAESLEPVVRSILDK